MHLGIDNTGGMDEFREYPPELIENNSQSGTMPGGKSSFKHSKQNKKEKIFNCPVPGCPGVSGKLREHAYKCHLPNVFHNGFDPRDPVIARKRMKAVNVLACRVRRAKRSPKYLMLLLNESKVIPELAVITEDDAIAMTTVCEALHMKVPPSFSLSPINHIAVLIHWRPLLHLAALLRQYMRRWFKSIEINGPGPSSNLDCGSEWSDEADSQEQQSLGSSSFEQEPQSSLSRIQQRLMQQAHAPEVWTDQQEGPNAPGEWMDQQQQPNVPREWMDHHQQQQQQQQPNVPREWMDQQQQQQQQQPNVPREWMDQQQQPNAPGEWMDQQQQQQPNVPREWMEQQQQQQPNVPREWMDQQQQPNVPREWMDEQQRPNAPRKWKKQQQRPNVPRKWKEQHQRPNVPLDQQLSPGVQKTWMDQQQQPFNPISCTVQNPGLLEVTAVPNPISTEQRSGKMNMQYKLDKQAQKSSQDFPGNKLAQGDEKSRPQLRVMVRGGIILYKDPSSFPVRLPSFFPGWAVAVGIDPRYSPMLSDEEFVRLRCLCAEQGVCLGEIGLDRNKPPTTWLQQDRQLKQLLSLHRRNVPVILNLIAPKDDIYGQDVYSRGLVLMMGMCEPRQPIHLYGFHGTCDAVTEWLQCFPNTYFGFNEALADFNHEQVVALRSVPLDRMIIEINCAYSNPLIAAVNTKDLVIEMARYVAIKREMPLENVLKVVSENVQQLYYLNCQQ